MGDRVQITSTLSENASLPEAIRWFKAFADTVQSASARNLIQDVKDSGAALSTINNAAANQIPYFTGPKSVGLLSLGIAGANTIIGFNNVRNGITAAYTVQTSDAGATLGLGGNAFYTVTFPAPGSLNSNHFNVVVNEDTGRGKRITLTGGPSFILWPLQTCIVLSDNGVWYVLPASQRWVLPGNTTWFIDPVNGNDNNDGLASGSGALATFGAFNTIVGASIDTNRFLVFASLAAASTYSQLLFNAPVIGGGTVCLNGNGAAINNGGSASAAAVSCFTPTTQGQLFNSAFLIENCILTATGGGDELDISSGNAVVYQGMTFGAVTGGGGHIRVDSNNSRLFCQSNYSINGGGAFHLASVGLALLDFNVAGFTATLTGTPAFTTAFAWATIMSNLISLITYSGAATGPRFLANDNSVIYTNGSNPLTYFPGNVNGTTPTGGLYV